MRSARLIGFIFVVIIVLSIIAIGSYSGWFDPHKDYITAKEASAIAAKYALEGEPDARLYGISLLSQKCRVFPEDQGKFSDWEIEFRAPDGADIRLEIRDRELFVYFPWEGPASQKKSSGLWMEARTRSDLYPSLYNYCLDEWVDSTMVFKDAQNRMIEEFKKEGLLVYSMDLDSSAWEILLLDGWPNGVGYKYYYHTVNDSYFKSEFYYATALP